MEAEIVNAANAIGQYLNQHGETPLGKLMQQARLSNQLLLMGLGWLAREGKLSFVQNKMSVKVSLKESSSRHCVRRVG
jgi:cytochrome b